MSIKNALEKGKLLLQFNRCVQADLVNESYVKAMVEAGFSREEVEELRKKKKKKKAKMLTPEVRSKANSNKNLQPTTPGHDAAK